MKAVILICLLLPMSAFAELKFSSNSQIPKGLQAYANLLVGSQCEGYTLPLRVEQEKVTVIGSDQGDQVDYHSYEFVAQYEYPYNGGTVALRIKAEDSNRSASTFVIYSIKNAGTAKLTCSGF